MRGWGSIGRSRHTFFFSREKESKRAFGCSAVVLVGYEEAFSLKGTSLCPDMEEACDRLLEFYAGNAFLLGLRTGCYTAVPAL